MHMSQNSRTPETMLKPCYNSKQQANTKIEIFWQNVVSRGCERFLNYYPIEMQRQFGGCEQLLRIVFYIV